MRSEASSKNDFDFFRSLFSNAGSDFSRGINDSKKTSSSPPKSQRAVSGVGALLKKGHANSENALVRGSMYQFRADVNGLCKL